MTARFLAIAYGFSWSVAAALWATGGLSGIRHVVGGFAFMLGPAIAALIVTPREARRKTFALRPRIDRWLVFAWAVPLLVVTGATLGSALIPGASLLSPADALMAKLSPEDATKLASVSPVVLSLGLVAQAFVFGPFINAPYMLSEELGWRGTLWSQWNRFGFWPNALATGVVWGFWHAPLILMGHNYPDAPVLGVALMVLFCVLIAPTLHLVRERGGSIWHACLFHGTINAGATLGALCIRTDHWFARGVVGLPGLVLLALAIAATALIRRSGPRPSRVGGSIEGPGEEPSPLE